MITKIDREEKLKELRRHEENIRKALEAISLERFFGVVLDNLRERIKEGEDKPESNYYTYIKYYIGQALKIAVKNKF